MHVINFPAAIVAKNESNFKTASVPYWISTRELTAAVWRIIISSFKYASVLGYGNCEK
jgi:hypothetical protein